MNQETAVNEIENTRRQMYADLKRSEHMVGSTHLFKTLQDSLEEHLEALRVGMKNREDVGQSFGESLGRIVSERDSLIQKLSSMTEERDQIQQRLHAIDHAYCEQSNLVSRQAAELDRVKLAAQTAGDCIRDTQTVNRSYQIEIKSLNQQLQARDETIGRLRAEGRQHLDDCRSAEKLSDSLDEKLRDARAVIGQQEQLIVGQRLAIADLYLAAREAPRRRTRAQIEAEMAPACCHEFYPAFPGGERCIYCCEPR